MRGRALKNQPVADFSEGASLQEGGNENAFCSLISWRRLPFLLMLRKNGGLPGGPSV
jgi:hypothetical protein